MVQKYVRDLIASGKVKENEQLPTEQEIAERLGVSIGTVKLSLKDLVSEGLIYREQGKGTFVSLSKRGPSDQDSRSHSVGVLVSRIFSSSICASIVKGIENVLRIECLGMLVGSTENNPGRFYEVIETFISQEVVGVIAYVLQGTDADVHNIRGLERLKNANIPVVLVDRWVEGMNFSCVTTDNFNGSYELTRHLLNLGHKRIAFLSEETSSVTLARAAGYEKALMDFGFDVDPELKFVPGLSTSPELGISGDSAGREGVRYAMKLRQPPTAFVCINDTVARGAFYELKAMGINCPGDAAIVGYDDSDFAESFEVPLTTVRQPGERMGAESARLLIDDIKGVNTVCKHVVLESKLIVRESCGAKFRKI